MTTVHARTCHICEANCGVLVEVDGRDVVSIKGDPGNVLSRGHICPKATALADLQNDPDRLQRPVKSTPAGWQEIEWEQAYSEIAARFARLDGVALYIGNPTAHNYGISTQIKALRKALGVRAIYSASTLDQIPHQLVQIWMYGHNALFPIPDIDRTKFLLIVGGNPVASNGSVWTVPDFRRRVRDLQVRGGRLVVIDPRRTETAEVADAHHFIRPGTDTALFLAILKSLDEAGRVRPGRLAPMLDDGWEAAWQAIRGFDIAALADFCGIAEAEIRALAAALGSGEPAVVYGRMGVSVQSFGTLNHWLIQLINIATGNLDREGGTMFSAPVIDLAATSGGGTHGRFHSRVGNHPEVLSEFPAASLAEEITTPGEGQVRGLVTVAGNPVLSSPGGERLDAALETLDTMVAIDMYVTETSRHADYILPPCGPLEKDHYPLALGPIAVRNFACYSPATLPMSDGAKSDWEIVAELARAIAQARGTSLPNIRTPREALDAMLKASNYPGLSLAELEKHPHGIDFGPHRPRLPERLGTHDKRIACAPALCLDDLARFRTALNAVRPDTLRLIGRRHVRSNNSWLHNSPRLIKGPNRCTLMIHPSDAAARGIANGAAVRVASATGEVVLPADITDAVMPGVVSMPHGFGHGRKGVRLSVASERPGVSFNDLTDPDALDPLSGNAVLNGIAVSVEPAALVVAAE